MYDRFHDITMTKMEASDGVKSCGSFYPCPDGEPGCQTRSLILYPPVTVSGIVVRFSKSGYIRILRSNFLNSKIYTNSYMIKKFCKI